MNVIPNGMTAEVAHYKAVMAQRGIKQATLAREIGVTRASVSQFLNGLTKGVRPYKRGWVPIGDMIAAALGVDPDLVSQLRQIDRNESATAASLAAAQRLRALKAQAGSDGAQSPVDLRHSGVAATSWSDPRFSPAA